MNSEEDIQLPSWLTIAANNLLLGECDIFLKTEADKSIRCKPYGTYPPFRP